MPRLTTIAVTRRTAIAAMLSATCMAQADPGYPRQGIKIVAPFNSGTVDILSRAFAERLASQLGVAVIVDTQAGAGGIIGASFVAKVVPDGYTLLFTAIDPMIMAPLLQRKTPYDPTQDLTPIAKVGSAPMILVAHPSAPFQTAEEMVAYAKKNPERLNYASSGAGTPDHIIMERLQDALGFRATIVPYKSTAQKTVDTLAGQIPITLLSLSGAQQYLAAKTLRPLAIGSLKRNPALPNVPTMSELTRKPFDATLGYGVLGPAKMPADIVAKLHAEVAKSLNSTQIQSIFVNLGAEPGLLDPKAFAAEIAINQAESRALVQRLNLAQ